MKTLSLQTLRRTGKLLIFVAVLNVAVWGAFSYLLSDIHARAERITVLNATVGNGAARKESLRTAKDRVVTTTAERGKLDTLAVPKDGVVPFLNLLQTLGAQNGTALKVLSVSIEPAASPDIFETVKVNLEATGLWSDVYRLAALFESMPLALRVDRVDFGKRAVSDAKARDLSGSLWTVTMELAVSKFK